MADKKPPEEPSQGASAPPPARKKRYWPQAAGIAALTAGAVGVIGGLDALRQQKPEAGSKVDLTNDWLPDEWQEGKEKLQEVARRVLHKVEDELGIGRYDLPREELAARFAQEARIAMEQMVKTQRHKRHIVAVKIGEMSESVGNDLALLVHADPRNPYTDADRAQAKWVADSLAVGNYEPVFGQLEADFKALAEATLKEPDVETGGFNALPKDVALRIDLGNLNLIRRAGESGNTSAFNPLIGFGERFQSRSPEIAKRFLETAMGMWADRMSAVTGEDVSLEFQQMVKPTPRADVEVGELKRRKPSVVPESKGR